MKFVTMYKHWGLHISTNIDCLEVVLGSFWEVWRGLLWCLEVKHLLWWFLRYWQFNIWYHDGCKKAKLQAGIKPTALCSAIDKENSIEFLLNLLHYISNYYMAMLLISYGLHATHQLTSLSHIVTVVIVTSFCDSVTCLVISSCTLP